MKYWLVIFSLLILFFPGASQTDTSRVDLILGAADSLYRINQYDLSNEQVRLADEIISTWADIPFKYAYRINAIQADIAYSQANYLKVIYFDSLNLNALKHNYGPKSLQVANHLLMMATSELKLGRNEQALLINREAEIIYRDSSETHPVKWAHSLRALGTNYFYLGDFEKWGAYYQQAIKLFENHLKPEDPQLALVYSSLASYESVVSVDFNAALGYHLQAYEIYQAGDTMRNAYSDCLNKIGLTYETLGQFDKAIFFYRRAYRINEIIYPPDHPEVANTLENIAFVYVDKMKDYPRGLDLYREQYGILKKKLGLNHTLTQRAQFNIANTLLKLGQLSDAKHQLDSLINNHREKNDQGLRILTGYYIAQASVYKSLNDIEASIQYLNKALLLNEKKIGDKRNQAAILNNLSEATLAKEEYEKSRAFQQQANQIYNEIFGARHHISIQGQIQLARIFFESKQPDDAILLIDQLIEQEASEPINNQIEEIDFPYILIELYDLKSQIFYNKFRLNNAVENLVLAKQYLMEAVRLSHDIRTSFHLDDSKEWALQKSLSTLDRAMGLNYDLYQLTKDQQYLIEAISIASKSKGSILYEMIKNLEAQQFANVPDSITHRLFRLKHQLQSFKQDQYKGDSLSFENLNKLRNLQTEYLGLINKIEKEYEDYYQLTYQNSSLNIENIQDLLESKNHSLVEYEFADSVLYAYYITADTLCGFKIDSATIIRDLVSQIIKLQADFERVKDLPIEKFLSYSKTFSDIAYRLYRILLDPILSITGLPKELLIIPSEELNYLPFELLLTSQPSDEFFEFRTFPYLVRKCAISYSFSIPVLEEMCNHFYKSNDLWALAPQFDSVYHQQLSHGSLRFNKREAISIANIWRGDYDIGELATKMKFAAEADDYGLIHLATHGSANMDYGNDSYISFQPAPIIEDQLLKASEIYSMRLPLQLITLSACETAMGNLLRGEGLIGLSRSIAYAGSKRILTSLWRVDDQVTEEIMLSFYQYLYAGDKPAVALQRSKLNYLQNVHSNLLAHPSYWSSFILIGDPQALALPSTIPQIYLFIGGFLLLGLLGFWWILKNK